MRSMKTFAKLLLVTSSLLAGGCPKSPTTVNSDDMTGVGDDGGATTMDLTQTPTVDQAVAADLKAPVDLKAVPDMALPAPADLAGADFAGLTKNQACVSFGAALCDAYQRCSSFVVPYLFTDLTSCGQRF